MGNASPSVLSCHTATNRPLNDQTFAKESFDVLCFFPRKNGSRCCGYRRYTRSRTAQRPSDHFHRSTVLRSFNSGVKADKNGRVALRATRRSCPTRWQRLALRFIPTTQRLTVHSMIKPLRRSRSTSYASSPEKAGADALVTNDTPKTDKPNAQMIISTVAQSQS